MKAAWEEVIERVEGEERRQSGSWWGRVLGYTE
jgi:hypothetical protein